MSETGTCGGSAVARVGARDMVIEGEVLAASIAPRRKPARPAKRKVRRQVKWSAKREGLFLAKLAATSNVAASIRASGLSETNVYRRRRADEAFRVKWAVALREGYNKLESELLDRALNGVVKAVWYGGKRVGTVREYNDRVGLQLLRQHGGTVNGDRPMAVDVPIETLRAELKAKLSEMNLRMGGVG